MFNQQFEKVFSLKRLIQTANELLKRTLKEMLTKHERTLIQTANLTLKRTHSNWL